MAQQQQFALLLVTILYLAPLRLQAVAVVALTVSLQVGQTMMVALAVLAVAAELVKAHLEVAALEILRQSAHRKDQMAATRCIKQALLQHITAVAAAVHQPQALLLHPVTVREAAAQELPRLFLVRL